MSASTKMNEPGLSRREEMSVSGDAISQAPWTGAAVTGGIVALGDFGWHMIGGSFGLGGLNDALSLGVVAFFVTETAGSESAAVCACITAARKLRDAMIDVAARSLKAMSASSW